MNIKFVSYTGKWPILCSGVATFLIDGKEIKFGHETSAFNFKSNSYNDNNYEKFWLTGGSTNWKTGAIYISEWELSPYWSVEDKNHPKWLIDIMPTLLSLFNENVEHGCCGGCL